MKFHRLIGKHDPAAVEQAEKKLSSVFLELASNPKLKLSGFGSGIGGDPLLFSLIFPYPNIATTAIPTAATDGKAFYWNVGFINSLHPIGLRLVLGHEGTHAIFAHPNRRGGRNVKLFNIAVDFIANGFIMADLKHRGLDPHSYFTKYLGEYLTLEETLLMYADPMAFAIKKGWSLKDLPKATWKNDEVVVIDPEVAPTEVKPSTEPEKPIEPTQPKVKFFYADPTLTDDMLRPEKIYEMLLKVIPRCPECGKLGVYYAEKDQNDDQDGKSKGKSKGKEDHSGHCGTCSQGYDIFGLGGEVDEHIDVKESQENLAKNLANAINVAKSMAGSIPGGLETELGELTAPQVKWQDVILGQMHRSRVGNSKADYSRFKSRQLFMGLLTPKKKGNVAKFVCLFDTSASMTKDDKSFVLSQLQSLDQRAEGVVVPFDTQTYHEDATKLTRVRVEDLLAIKATGGGGTIVPDMTEIRKKYPCDFIVVLTDAGFSSQNISTLINPGIPVFWVVVSSVDFSAPFGRVFNLYN